MRSDAVIPVTVRTFAVTTIETVVVSGSYAELVGVKVTDNVCVPTGRRVPLAGVYTNTPATFAVAFCWVAERLVPYITELGVLQVNPALALIKSAVVVG